MRRALLYASVAAPLFMTFVSLSSIVEGLIQWGAFIRDLTDAYTRFVRDPLHDLANVMWPAAWPKIPIWFVDVVVLWTSFFGVTRAYIALEEEYVKTGEGAGLSASRLVLTNWREKLKLWLFGPIGVWYFSRVFVAKMQLLVDLEHAWFGAPAERPAFIEDAERVAREMNSGYWTLAAYACVGLVVILFLNWQMAQECKDPSRWLDASGICEWRLLSPAQRKSMGLPIEV